jgi:hypothetical protein
MLLQHLILSDRLSRSATAEETNNPRKSTTLLDKAIASLPVYVTDIMIEESKSSTTYFGDARSLQ